MEYSRQNKELNERELKKKLAKQPLQRKNTSDNQTKPRSR
jgi:hypothetical protein